MENTQGSKLWTFRCLVTSCYEITSKYLCNYSFKMDKNNDNILRIIAQDTVYLTWSARHKKKVDCTVSSRFCCDASTNNTFSKSIFFQGGMCHRTGSRFLSRINMRRWFVNHEWDLYLCGFGESFGVNWMRH